jgi:hypothetical protein
VTPAPTQSNVFAQLRSFLLSVLPSGVVVVPAQQNRVPEPVGVDFVVMTQIRQERIETNIDGYADGVFTGSIAGPTMTITAVNPKFPNAQIGIGSTIFGVGITAGTSVSAILTGTGQIGTYTVSPPQTVGPLTISTGTKQIMMPTRHTVQLDFHSADLSSAGDMAATVSALFRDEFAVLQFQGQSPYYGVAPLYADDPRQAPWVNDQQQVEWRWTLDALLQSNIVIQVPQQFADSVVLTPVSVDAKYPLP